MSLFNKYVNDINTSLIEDFPKYVSLSEAMFSELNEQSTLKEKVLSRYFLLTARFYENKLDEAYELSMNIDNDFEPLKEAQDEELNMYKYKFLIAKATLLGKLNYLDKEIEIYLKILEDVPQELLDIIFNNLSNAYAKLGEYDNAKRYIDKGIKNFKVSLEEILSEKKSEIDVDLSIDEYNVYHSYIYMLSNKATIYMKNGLYNDLLAEIDWANAIYSLFNFDKRILLIKKCEILKNAQFLDEALKLSETVLKKTVENNISDNFYYDYKIQAEIYLLQNNYHQFKKTLEKALALDENVDIINVLDFYEDSFHFVLKNGDLNLLRKLADKLKVLREKHIGSIKSLTNAKIRTQFITAENLLKEKQLEELNIVNKKLSKKNKELLRFASMVAHDIKSPIRSINSLLQIIQNDASTIEDKENIKSIIQKSFSSLTSLVDDLLSFARAGDYNSKKTKFSLESVIEKIKSNFKNEFETKEVKLIVQTEGIEVFAHQTAFLQIFLNLFSNAIMYSSPKRKLIIELTAKTIDNHLEISFKDNGLGIAKEEQTKIFEPLTRGSNSENISGSGLGLNTIAQILNYYEGNILVESEVDKGTNFILRFPQLILTKH